MYILMYWYQRGGQISVRDFQGGGKNVVRDCRGGGQNFSARDFRISTAPPSPPVVNNYRSLIPTRLIQNNTG